MEWSIFSRAKRAFRDDLRLHLTTIGGLVIAFVCLAVTLLVVANLGRVENVWKQSRHITVYLQDGAKEDDVATLRFALESLPEITQVQYVSQENARAKLGDQEILGAEAASLPAEFFPASLELSVKRGVGEARLEQIVGRIQGFSAVQDVDLYRDLFEQLSALLSASRWAAGGLALLVAICVLAVIGHTVRLAVSEKREQIEVLKLCGATNGFVRGPFVVEGVVQGLGAAALAVLLLLVVYAIWRPALASAIGLVVGVPPSFLDPLTAFGIVLGGGMVGGLGSFLSLRRHLKI